MDDAEWKKRLTPEQYAVLRQKGTESPFSGLLLDNTKPGTYVCAGCGTAVFLSNNKFESHCGWPSFYDVASNSAVTLSKDTTHGMTRTEVLCAACGGHLGHLFDDAPDQPTGLRYCINSVSLDFKPRTSDEN